MKRKLLVLAAVSVVAGLLFSSLLWGQSSQYPWAPGTQTGGILFTPPEKKFIGAKNDGSSGMTIGFVNDWFGAKTESLTWNSDASFTFKTPLTATSSFSIAASSVAGIVAGATRYLSLSTQDALNTFPALEITGNNNTGVLGSVFARVSFSNTFGAPGEVARIQVVEGGGGSLAGQLQFFTAPNGLPLTERLRIGENGSVLWNLPLPDATGDLNMVAGSMTLPYNSGYYSRNQLGTSNLQLLSLGTIGGGTNTIAIGATGAVVAIGSPASVATASPNPLVLMNNTGAIVSSNAAGSATLELLRLNNANQLFVGAGAIARLSLSAGGADIQWGVPLVGLGGGVAPTLGTIGGAGPTVAGQNSWVRALDSTGAVFWVPVWK